MPRRKSPAPHPLKSAKKSDVAAAPPARPGEAAGQQRSIQSIEIGFTLIDAETPLSLKEVAQRAGKIFKNDLSFGGSPRDVAGLCSAAHARASLVQGSQGNAIAQIIGGVALVMAELVRQTGATEISRSRDQKDASASCFSRFSGAPAF